MDQNNNFEEMGFEDKELDMANNAENDIVENIENSESNIFDNADAPQNIEITQTENENIYNSSEPTKINNGYNNLFGFGNTNDGNSNLNNIYNSGNSSEQNENSINYFGDSNLGSNNQGNGETNSVQKDSPKIKEKKGGKKVFASIACGIVFGIFACFSFYAVNEVIGILGIGSVTSQGVYYSNNISDGPDLSNRVQTDTGEDVEIEDDTDNNKVMTIQNVSAVVTDVTDVVEATMPSIVSITNSFMYQTGFMSQEVEAKGSGIIVGNNDNEILIVTNFHVIDGNEKLSVTFCNDTDAPAEVKGTDSSMDLAVIAVNFDDVDSDTQDAIRYVTIGDSDNLKVGEPAIAIGNALGYGQSVTTGVISAVNRQIDMNGDGNERPFIQTDAAINEGNSGGALLNIAGELIGINSNKMGGTAVEGMGYAIPISSAKPKIEKLMVKETRKIVADEEKGCLGISGATLTYQEAAFYGYPDGVYVANVFADSAADEAGIEEGDLISSFDGERVTSMEQLQRILKYYKQGETVEVGVYKNSLKGYEETTVEVTLGSPEDIDG